MLSNRTAYNVLIQSKLVANYDKPRAGGVGLTPGKTNYAKYFCKVFRQFSQKPIKSSLPTPLTTIHIMIITHQNLTVSCVNFHISLFSRMVVVVWFYAHK